MNHGFVLRFIAGFPIGLGAILTIRYGIRASLSMIQGQFRIWDFES
jgi:hypothetical protein